MKIKFKFSQCQAERYWIEKSRGHQEWSRLSGRDVSKDSVRWEGKILPSLLCDVQQRNDGERGKISPFKYQTPERPASDVTAAPRTCIGCHCACAHFETADVRSCLNVQLLIAIFKVTLPSHNGMGTETAQEEVNGTDGTHQLFLQYSNEPGKKIKVY